jgi:integrase
MVLVAYMHGLRVSELVDLRWEQIDFRTAALHVRRVKQGLKTWQIGSISDSIGLDGFGAKACGGSQGFSTSMIG